MSEKGLPVLYVVVCGSPAATGVPDFLTQVQRDGWRACVITTPMGARFVDTERLARITGQPVRMHYKHPTEPDMLPVGDCFVVAPATFNTINKLAAGITDTLAVGLVCEGIGLGRPVIVAPAMNQALRRHSAYRRSINNLCEDGVRLVVAGPAESADVPGTSFQWSPVLTELARVRPVPAEAGQH